MVVTGQAILIGISEAHLTKILEIKKSVPSLDFAAANSALAQAQPNPPQAYINAVISFNDAAGLDALIDILRVVRG